MTASECFFSCVCVRGRVFFNGIRDNACRRYIANLLTCRIKPTIPPPPSRNNKFMQQKKSPAKMKNDRYQLTSSNPNQSFTKQRPKARFRYLALAINKLILKVKK